MGSVLGEYAPPIENDRGFKTSFLFVQLSTTCGQLKMKASDGKYYLTDVLDENGINVLLMDI